MSLDFKETQIEEIVVWLVVGAVVGGFLFSALDLGGSSNILGQIVIATVGAVLVLAVVG